MNEIEFVAMPKEHARHIQRGGTDAYDMSPQLLLSDGEGNQCRHCLQFIPLNQKMFVFAYRPFDLLQPFAETGPVFVCATECQRAQSSNQVPKMYFEWDTALIRGYDQQHSIVYGTGQNVKIDHLVEALSATFENEQVDYIHLRSSRYNCYQCRIDRKD